MSYPPENMPLLGAFLIGMCQVLAMMCSGISRLGMTLTTGRSLGYSLASSTRYSLIMGIPVLGASIIFSLPSLMQSNLSGILFLQMTLITLVISWPMFHVMLWLSGKESTTLFTLYRVLLGLGVLLWAT